MHHNAYTAHAESIKQEPEEASREAHSARGAIFSRDLEINRLPPTAYPVPYISFSSDPLGTYHRSGPNLVHATWSGQDGSRAGNRLRSSNVQAGFGSARVKSEDPGELGRRSATLSEEAWVRLHAQSSEECTVPLVEDPNHAVVRHQEDISRLDVDEATSRRSESKVFDALHQPMDEELELMYPDSDDISVEMEVDCSSPSRSEAEVERLTEVLLQGDSWSSCSPTVPSYPSPSPMEGRRPRLDQQVIPPTSNPSSAPAPDIRFYYYTPHHVSGLAFSSQPLPRSSDTGTEHVAPDPPRASTSRQHVWGSVLANQVPHIVDNPSISIQDLDLEDPVVRFLHEVGLDGRDRRLADKLRKAGILDDRRMQALGDLPESEFKSIRNKLRSDKVDYAAQLLICSGLKKRAGR